MAAKCPHCSTAIESLDGFVTQELHVQRLNAKTDANKEALAAKDGEIRLLESRVKDLSPKAQGYDEVVQERDSLKADMVRTRERTERRDALMGLGIPMDKLDAAEGEFNAIFQSKVAGLAPDQMFGFQDWDKWAATSFALASYFTKPAGTQQGAGAPAAPRLPNANTGAQSPPSTEAKLKPGEIQAYFQSAEFQALKKEDRTAKMTELKAKYPGAS